jgi:hypothetical protein
MELWASGFNAWNQLQFDGELPAQPRDLTEFTCVLKDNRVDVLRASLSATLGMWEIPFFSLHSCQVSRHSGVQLSSSELRGTAIDIVFDCHVIWLPPELRPGRTAVKGGRQVFFLQ